MLNYTPDSAPADSVLVQCHISDRDEKFSISVFADLVKVKKEPNPNAHHQQRGGGRRNAITQFSSASRKRMLEKLAMLRDASGGYFATLTYAGRFMWTPTEVKNHLAIFRKALLRRFPRVGAFWRMELKPRLSGASAGEIVPHFHLLIFGANPPSLAYMRRWVSHVWSRIAHYPDSEPRKLRTQCDEITTRRHAANYASKYAAKVGEDSTLVLLQDWNSWGRHWGVFGELDLAAVMCVQVGLDQLVRFKRLVRAWLKSRGSRYAKRLAKIREDFGCSVFGLGDLSPGGSGDLFDSTISKMIWACQERA